VGVDAVLAGELPEGPAARARRRTLRGAWVGIIPFALYVAFFLGLPLYEVVYGAFTTDAGSATSGNLSASFHSQYLEAFKTSLLLSLWTALIGGFFGLWLAAAVVTSKPHSALRRIIGSASGVFAYFAGVPLAFTWIAALGHFGTVTLILKDIGIDLYAGSFNISSLTGVYLAYVYFQVPLMVLLITPALEGLRTEWREAASGLGASTFSYLRYVAAPVLAPAVLGALLLLFGNAFAAYATALALVNGTLPLVPSQIQSLISGNVFVNEKGLGLALGVEMIVVIGFVMLGYSALQRRAGRWLQ